MRAMRAGCRNVVHEPARRKVPGFKNRRGARARSWRLQAAWLLWAAVIAARWQEAATPHRIWRAGVGDRRSIPAETTYLRKVFLSREPSWPALPVASGDAFDL